MNDALSIQIGIMTRFYSLHYPTAKRRQSEKNIKVAWASMYRWTLDADPCQVGAYEYNFFSTVRLEDFTKLFRAVEQIELEKRNHSVYAAE